MSRTYRRHRQRHDYDWVLRDYRWVNGTLVPCAGALDILPMALLKADIHLMASAFTHWVVVTLFIAYMNMPLAPWLQGTVIRRACCRFSASRSRSVHWWDLRPRRWRPAREGSGAQT